MGRVNSDEWIWVFCIIVESILLYCCIEIICYKELNNMYCLIGLNFEGEFDLERVILIMDKFFF